jgi:hypothetical protein
LAALGLERSLPFSSSPFPSQLFLKAFGPDKFAIEEFPIELTPEDFLPVTFRTEAAFSNNPILDPAGLLSLFLAPLENLSNVTGTEWQLVGEEGMDLDKDLDLTLLLDSLSLLSSMLLTDCFERDELDLLSNAFLIFNVFISTILISMGFIGCPRCAKNLHRLTKC